MAAEQDKMNSSVLSLRYPANWLFITFMGVLALLHLAIAIPAYSGSPVEAQICLLAGSLFAGVALLMGLTHREMVIRPGAGYMGIARSLGFLRMERKVPFEQVQAVRLTYTPSTSAEIPRIEVLCGDRAIACPMTAVPRQQALCMAMLMNVELIRIYTKQETCLCNRVDENNQESFKGEQRSDEQKGDDNLAA